MFFNFLVLVNTWNFAIFILYHNLFYSNFFLFKEFQHVAWDNSFWRALQCHFVMHFWAVVSFYVTTLIFVREYNIHVQSTNIRNWDLLKVEKMFFSVKRTRTIVSILEILWTAGMNSWSHLFLMFNILRFIHWSNTVSWVSFIWRSAWRSTSALTATTLRR